MKKVLLFTIFIIAFLLLPKNVNAVNECSSIWTDPGTTGTPGTIFTVRTAGCPSSNVGYRVQLLNRGEVIAEVDMADLTGDKSQYSATITQTSTLNQGSYSILIFDKSTNNPIQGTSITIESDTVVTDINCNVVSFDLSRNLRVCIGGFASVQDLHSTNVTTRCTEAAAFKLCPPPNLQSLSGLAPGDDGNGKFFGCFNIENVNPEITRLSLEFNEGPTQVCTLNNIDVSAGRPNYLCYPGDDISKNGVKTALGCVPIDSIADFLIFSVRWTMGIVGGGAILLIIIASYQIMTSQGDKYKLQSGKDMLTAALAGLILAIFAIVVIQLFGKNILQIF